MSEMTAEDKKWQAQMDARTLAEAETVKGDEERLTAATTVAQEMAEEQIQEALSMKRVANLSGKLYPSLSESA
jgi:hypothetical protein